MLLFPHLPLSCLFRHCRLFATLVLFPTLQSVFGRFCLYALHYLFCSVQTVFILYICNKSSGHLSKQYSCFTAINSEGT
ncbi:hypothetical protein EDB19DRAFT_841578 [Suillus lakei]|nr:hypothetical protein EDB19DRAFT_841578 [Suillus lakei]